MPEVSIKFRKNGTRGNITPGECINLDGPLSPGGVKGLKFGTNMQGGDGSLEFNIGYRKHAPAKKNDGAEVYYGIQRVTQHAIMDVQPDKDNGVLKFTGQGHGAHMEKSFVLFAAPADRGAATATAWFVWNASPYSAQALGFAFLNASQRYDVLTGLDNSSIINYNISAGKTIEDILAEVGKYNDSIRGMFPGRESDPNGLGCFYYHRHRTLNQIPKWFISEEDLRLGKFGVTEDLSEYCNYVSIIYNQTGVGATATFVEDTASQAIYTPGSREAAKIDITSQSGTISAAGAQAVGQAYLAIYGKPVLKGTITLPLQNLHCVGGGSNWAGLIRGGDIVRVERDYGACSDIMIDTTMVDVDAGTIELGTPNPSTLETLLAGQLAA